MAKPQRTGFYSEPKFYVSMLVILAVLVLLTSAGFVPLGFSPVTADSIIGLLTPLFVIALFLERALEVFVKTWRRMGRDTIEREVTKAKEALQRAKEANRGVPQAQEALDTQLDELAKYRAETGRIAFISGVSAGVLISIVGVRVLYPLADLANEPLSGIQLVAFNLSDVFLTGGLIGGGSEGIHKVVTVITEFLEKTRQKIREAPTQ